MIYYVEDDENIRELVVYTLAQTGLEAAGFESADTFFDALSHAAPDLILLDIMLPKEDGLSLLRRLRADAETAKIPVIMLTAKGSEYDKVQGLDMGADDYLAKPFGMAELVARVKACLRRAGPRDAGGRITLGALSLDTAARRVTIEEKPVPLTKKEYELLLYLMENRGIALSREKILDKIWDYGYAGGTRTVDVHVQTLRGKLNEYASMIETVHGVGYRFGG